jgi:hypothetical protein
MHRLTWLTTFWRAALATLLLAGLLWLASKPHSQSPEGVLGLFAFSLFIAVGFILFGDERFEKNASSTSAKTEYLA